MGKVHSTQVDYDDPEMAEWAWMNAMDRLPDDAELAGLPEAPRVRRTKLRERDGRARRDEHRPRGRRDDAV